MTLSNYERELVLKYGYPSGSIQSRLEKLRGSAREATINLDRTEAYLMAGDMTNAIVDRRASSEDEEELDALCERFERALDL